MSTSIKSNVANFRPLYANHQPDMPMDTYRTHTRTKNIQQLLLAGQVAGSSVEPSFEKLKSTKRVGLVLNSILRITHRNKTVKRVRSARRNTSTGTETTFVSLHKM